MTLADLALLIATSLAAAVTGVVVVRRVIRDAKERRSRASQRSTR